MGLGHGLGNRVVARVPGPLVCGCMPPDSVGQCPYRVEAEVQLTGILALEGREVIWNVYARGGLWEVDSKA